MPSFKSDLTNKNFSGGAMRQFDVPDVSEEDDGMPDIAELNRRMADRGLPPVDEATIRQMYAMQQPNPSRTYEGRAPVVSNTNPDPLFETERAIKEARAAKLHGKVRLNEGAKRRIEALCDITRSKKTVDVDGAKFSLRTLKSKEMREALMAASKFDGTIESPFEIIKQILARSLYAVMDTEISLYLGDTSLDSVFVFLDEMDEKLIARLHAEYTLLSDEADKRYAIKSDEDAKEVVEELKK